MEVDGEVRSESGVRSSEAAIGAFTTELASVIEQLEMDCPHDRLSAETAARVRELRERADRIFSDFD